MFQWTSDNDEQQPQLVIHESGRRWFEAIGNGLASQNVRIRHSTNPLDTRRLLEEPSARVLVLELGARPVRTLTMLSNLAATCCDVSTIVVASPDQRSLEAAARDFGAVAFLCEPLVVGEVVRLVQWIIRGRRQSLVTD